MTDTTPWAPRLLRFPRESAFRTALTTAGWPSLSAVPAEAAQLVVLGTLRGPSTTGPDGEDVPGPALSGFYVRALFAGAPPAALASAEVAEVAGAPVVPGEAAPEAGGRVVLEVLPVPLRLALAETPSPIPGHEDAEAAFNAVVLTMPRAQQIAWEYLVIAKRSDLLAMTATKGIPDAWMDEVLARAAGKPDSGAVWGARP